MIINVLHYKKRWSDRLQQIGRQHKNWTEAEKAAARALREGIKYIASTPVAEIAETTVAEYEAAFAALTNRNKLWRAARP